MKTKTYPCNYQAAVNWLDGDLVLIKNPKNLKFYEVFFPDQDNIDIDTLLEKEVFQAYLTSYNAEDINFLHEHFGLRFAYCEDLDLYLLLVDHYGTSWNYVFCETDIENASCKLGENPKPF